MKAIAAIQIRSAVFNGILLSPNPSSNIAQEILTVLNKKFYCLENLLASANINSKSPLCSSGL